MNPRAKIVFLMVITFWSASSFFANAENLPANAQSSRSSDSALQEWCDDQVKRLLKQLDLDKERGDRIRNHYNLGLHKCFMAIETRRGTIVIKTLLDAYAQRTYASYFSMSNAASLRQCTLMPLGHEKRACSSDEEYEAFVAYHIQ